MLRFAAGLGNTDVRRHVLPIFKGDLTTLEDEGARALHPDMLTALRPSTGNRGSAVGKVLRYKSEGRWFDSRWSH